MKRAKYSALLVCLLAISLLFLIKFAYAQTGVGIGLRINPKPIVNFTNMNNSCFANENPEFHYSVHHENNITSCIFKVNHQENLTNNSVGVNSTMNYGLSNLAFRPYNLTINCTDILNVSTITEFSFSVNSMRKFSGATTNVSKVDCRNISNFVLENKSAGRINFSGGIDLSNGFDIDQYVNISFNKIELDSDALSALNTSATLQIEGLTLTNPRILMGSVVCPSDICTKISYSGGILIFNVSHFTQYKSEETPDSGDGGGGGTGGGGGGTGGGGGGGGGTAPAFPIITDFSIDKNSLKIVLKQGQTKTETFSIKNIGTTLFDVTAFLHEIAQFKLSPELNEVATTLAPNEEKTIELVFKALENEKPDIYPSKISFKSPSSEKELITIVEVDSAEPLFDVDVEVSPESKKAFPGDEILLEINLFNVRGFGRVDVVVDYAIKDLQGNIVAGEHETLAVETQAKFTRRLTIPSSLKPGNYVAFAKVTYADSVGTSSDLFEVTAKTIRLYPIQFKNYRVVLIGAGGIAILASIVIFSAYKSGYLKKKVPKTKAEEVKSLKIEDKSQKLRKELAALEAAHSSGFISEESYQKSKERIQDKLNRLG